MLSGYAVLRLANEEIVQDYSARLRKSAILCAGADRK